MQVTILKLWHASGNMNILHDNLLLRGPFQVDFAVDDPDLLDTIIKFY